MKTIAKLAAIAAAAVLTACGGGGSLEVDPALGYDFAYKPELSVPRNAVASDRTLTLQARIIWDGPRGEVVTVGQHVPMAFTQVNAPGTPTNAEGEALWTHGVGVFLGTRGLAIEFWNRPGDSTVGTFWSQDTDRCAVSTDGQLTGTTQCLAAAPGLADYLTPAPDFQLKKGTPYILTMYLSRTTPSWMSLQTKLYEVDGNEVREVQSGKINFQPSSYFPDTKQPLRASIARTPGGATDHTVRFEFLGDDIAFTDTGRQLSAQEAKALL